MLELPNWHKYGSYNRVMRVSQCTLYNSKVFIAIKGDERSIHQINGGKDNSWWRSHPASLSVINRLMLWGVRWSCVNVVSWLGPCGLQLRCSWVSIGCVTQSGPIRIYPKAIKKISSMMLGKFNTLHRDAFCPFPFIGKTHLCALCYCYSEG